MARWLLDGRTLIAVFSVGVALPFVMAIPARANTQCRLVTAVEEVHHVSELPPDLLKLLSPIAEGGDLKASVSDPTRPLRLFIRAGHRGTDWFVWYDRVAAGYSVQALVARVLPSGDMTVLANARTVPEIVVSSAGTDSNTLCSFTDGVFAGQVPPYPEGTWPASGY